MLWEHQIPIINKTREHIRQGCKRILIESPTGSGKTRMGSYMLKGAHERGWDSWFVVHRVELIEQTANTFKEEGIPFGIIAAGHPRSDHNINICSIDTLKNLLRAGTLPIPKFVKWDEAHHLAADKWSVVHEHCKDAVNVGLSATPVRRDGKPLGKYFDVMVNGPTIPWLIEKGYLSDFEYYGPDVPDFSHVERKGDDFSPDQVDKIMAGRAIVGSIVSTWQRRASGLLTIGFAPNVKTSQIYVDAFRAAGIRAAHLDGTTEKGERRDVAMAFARREIDVLWNVGLFGEGFDLSALAKMDVSIEALIKANPTHSLGIDKQQNGRALRRKNRKAVILDHAGNWTRLGFPDDIIEWTLDKKPQRKGAGGTSVAITRCFECYALFRGGRASCPECGNTRETKERKMHYMEGELKEIERQEAAKRRAEEKAAAEVEKARRRRQEGAARSYADFKAIAEERGYEPGWAFHKAKNRGYV